MTGSAKIQAYYFWGINSGVLAAQDPNFKIIYISQNTSWKLASVPTGVSTIRQIRPIAGKLYAANDDTDLLVSLDSGETWHFAGLGLRNSYDVYADPFGTIHTLTDSMRMFARVDERHCMATGTNNQAWISNDGGVTWMSVSVGMNDTSSFVYGDTCKKVFVYHGDEGTVYRSTDFGQTWIQTFVGCGGYSEVIAGTNSVVYLFTVQGLYRSIDAGASWTTIYETLFDPHFLSVFGPLGQDVAVIGPNGGFDQTDVWLTTDGGDYGLRTPIQLSDSLGNLLDTLILSDFCLGTPIPIPFLSTLDSLVVQPRIISDSFHEYSIVDSAPLHLFANIPDTTWLLFKPHSLPDSSSVTLSFENKWHCSTWQEFRTIIVTTPSLEAVQQEHLAHPTQIIFTAPQQVGTASYTNSGCEPDTLLDESVDDTLFAWIGDSLPLVVFPDSSIFLRYVFRPVDTGTFIGFAKIIISISGYLDTVSLELNGTFSQSANVVSHTTGKETIIYPNPTSSLLNIGQCSGTLSILDPLGRPYTVPRNGNTLDVSSLPNGVYFLSDGVSRTKFVIERP
ncbi:MAG TPA: T9SS type A sorting domain-containing protein [Candidatus Kapabacteria bacterium]